MQSGVINIKKDTDEPDIIESVLSFKPFVQELKNRVDSEKTIRRRFYEDIVSRFEENDAFEGMTDPDSVGEHTELLELVFASLAPLISDETHLLWALSTPVPHRIFYCTDAFAAFFSTTSLKEVKESFINDKEKFKRYRYEHIYSLILKKFYNLNALTKEDIIYSYVNPQTGLHRYYKIEADTSFIDIVLKGELPELDLSVIDRNLNQDNVYELLIELLPPDLFRFEGFSVLTFSDITTKYALDTIRAAIIDHTANQDDQNNVVARSLKTLAGDCNVEFGLLPFLKVNGKIVFDDDHCSASILLQCGDKAEHFNEEFNALIRAFLEEPKPYFFGKLTGEKTELHPILKLLHNHGVSSYGILPVFYNNQLSGVLEIYSKEGTVSFEQILSRLELSIPLIAQILQNLTDEFKAKIEKIIKSKFTSLQPSVQWKFNEAAWNYLKAKRKGIDKVEIASITFKQVFPLYGAIDIRDSTIARNRALREDLKLLLEILMQVLHELKNLHPLALIDELIYECSKWMNRISTEISANDEMLLSQFFESQANPFLSHFKETSPIGSGIINRYFEASDEAEGIAFARRRELEASIQQINVSVNSYFETVQAELQSTFPCYFEKFRTDGIEYDIYIGQSIAPEKTFNNLYLKNLRLWQIKSMVEVAKITHSLLEKTEVPLNTTQLIFVHSNPIDISFRNDERRFDVEGTYNIRYEIIKKRIDKVNIKSGNSRLTQPDKIALVYFNYREAEEYVQYISYLQEQHMLNDDLEYLDLEELQGVSGLKALRVGINYGDSELLTVSS